MLYAILSCFMQPYTKKKIKWDFLQLFSVFKGFFLAPALFPVLFNPLSAYLSEIVCKKTFGNARNSCRKSHYNLKLLYTTGPWMQEKKPLTN